MSENIRSYINLRFKKTLPTEDPKCSLVSAGCSMTYNSFASICMTRQINLKSLDETCINCKLGEKIRKGEKVIPPKGIKIIKPTGWIEQPIKYPSAHEWQAKDKKYRYGFNIQAIGEVKKFKQSQQDSVEKSLIITKKRLARKFNTWLSDGIFHVERTT